MKKKMFIAVMTIGVMSMLAGCGSIGNDGISDNKESKNRAKTEKEIDWSSIDTSQMTDDELIEVAMECIYSDPDQALEFLNPAIEHDNHEAIFLAGYIYGEVYRWQGRPDFQKAIECFDTADDVIFSKMCKAELYYHGDNVGIGYDEGWTLYHKIDDKSLDIDSLDQLAYKSVAYYVTGRMYRYYNGAAYDVPLAADLYEKAAELGNPDAMLEYAFFLSAGMERTKDVDAAVELVEESAELGNYDAVLSIGKKYIEGKSVNQDIDKGIAMIEEAADHNNIGAIRYLGYAYHEGEIVSKDDTKSIEYMDKWIELDNQYGTLDAYTFLSSEYYNGRKLMQDYERALEYNMVLYNAGRIGTAYTIGIMYENGYGTDIDIDKAIEYYEISAASDEGENAAERLAKMYREGELVDKDIDTAIKWYERAVECGDWMSAKVLGDIYHEGIETPQDEEKANEWYEIYEEMAPSC